MKFGIRAIAYATLVCAPFLGASAENLSYYEDIFAPDIYGKRLRFEVHSRLSTDIDESFISTKTRRAIENAMAQAFTVSVKSSAESEASVPVSMGNELSLLDRIKDGLTQNLKAEFARPSAILKLIDRWIRFEIHILPVLDSPHDYREELSSNQLLKVTDVGGFSKVLETELDPLNWENFQPTVDWLSKKTASQRYQYFGGMISLRLKILEVEPKLTIPNPLKRGIKGRIRYRRYFLDRKRVDSEELMNVTFERAIPGPRRPGRRRTSKSEEDVLVHLKKDFVFGQSYSLMTVDSDKTFDIESIQPDLSKVTFHFGRIQGPGGTVIKKEPTSHALLRVQRSNSDSWLALEKLSIDVRSNRISFDDTEVRELDAEILGGLSLSQRNAILETSTDKVVGEFELERFTGRQQ